MINMVRKQRTISGITMGDPSGIGPEIIIKSFENAEIRKSAVVVIGDFKVMKAAHKMLTMKKLCGDFPRIAVAGNKWQI
jgi:4-hydroxy-L-threonine phosphate dehydrogenase PdxA